MIKVFLFSSSGVIEAMIECQAATKKFVTYKKNPGLKGSMKSFFHREYQENTAVQNVSLSIKKGEFVGLLGPNGAGKTTLMKMLTGIVVPTSGEISVVGYKPFERKIDFRQKIALVMGQKSQLWCDIPAEDSFQLLQKYYQIDNKKFQQRLDHLSDILEVTKLLQIHVRKLSLGERMKMELIASMLHSPEVIFLDEPTIGLDIVGQTNIRKFLIDYQKENNSTIVLTSHYMADIKALCKRIIFISEGKKRFDGTVDQFETILGRNKFIRFVFSKPISPKETIWEGMNLEWNEDFTSVEIKVEESNLREIAKQILDQFPVIDFVTEQLPIERVMNSIMQNPSLMAD